MSKVSLSGLMVCCAVLAACSDTDSNGAVTAPNVAPAFSAASADLRGATTADGPFDLQLASDAGSTQMAAAAPQAATGGRASGHVGLTLGFGFFANIATEQYSFVALATDPSTPFAAKGQYDMTLTTVTGVLQEFHGKVICMSTVGNVTRVAGQLTSVLINGVQVPIRPNATHNIWTVTDNGEGQGTADTASPMIFFPLAGAQYHCATGWTPPQFNNEQGNIQVRPY